MKHTLNFALFVASLFVINTASADLDEAMDNMCAKIKSCSTAEAKRQGLPENVLAMMTTMFDTTCKTWMAPYANSLGEAGLEAKAEACIDSVVSVSCDTMMKSEGDFASKECDEFEKAAEKSGVDLENPSQ